MHLHSAADFAGLRSFRRGWMAWRSREDNACERNSARHIVFSSVGQGSLISHACAPVIRTVYLFLSYSYRLPVICTVSLLFVPFTCYSYRLPVIRTVFTPNMFKKQNGMLGFLLVLCLRCYHQKCLKNKTKCSPFFTPRGGAEVTFFCRFWCHFRSRGYPWSLPDSLGYPGGVPGGFFNGF